MKQVDRTYVELHRAEIIEAIRSGKIFIYPTDTIYGLGCNALMSSVVKKIRAIKNRDAKPFSVVAPDKAWIEEYCIVDPKKVDEFLPGPYTLIVKMKSRELLNEINPGGETLGVRIPKHWFADLIQEAGVPFITTSVNISGHNHMEKLEDVSQDFLNQVDYVVYEGEKRGESSQKINLLQEKPYFKAFEL